MILDDLIKNNEFPIIFVGAGISKRYLNNYPGWLDLLENIWNEFEMGDFYAELSSIKNKLDNKLTEKEKDFQVNVIIAKQLEKIFNDKFYSSEINIEGLDSKTAYLESINPFKKYLSNFFSHYEIKENIEDELSSFIQMINKSRVILTTNYDTFIEDIFTENTGNLFNKFIGQKGLFEANSGYCDLYKIHGCCKESNSIVITEDDYISYNKNSVLISSKIISLLLTSPIIFIGYSLTDLNIRKIIKDFSNSLTEKEKINFEKKIILINRLSGEEKLIEERVVDSDLNCNLTVINTDNFLEVFNKISEINQGVTPAEISKFEKVIKKLIVEKGKEKQLDKVLVNFIAKEDMENIDDFIKKNNIAVAIGDSAVLLKTPSQIEYLLSYILEDEIDLESQLRFLAQQNMGRTYPCLKYLTEDNIKNSKLYKSEKKTLNNRLKKLKEFNCNNITIKKELFSNIPDIIGACREIEDIKKKKNKESSLIIQNFDFIKIDEIKEYVLNELENMRIELEDEIFTCFRKLLIKYDFKINNN